MKIDFLKNSFVSVNEKQIKNWGFFQILYEETPLKIKKLFLFPNSSTSMQMHLNRAEYWFIVKGEANVILNNKELLLKEGESIYIKTQDIHKLLNKSREELIVIEIQIGTQCSEEDIIRY